MKNLILATTLIVFFSCKSTIDKKGITDITKLEQLKTSIDALYNSEIKKDAPGAALLVSYNGEILIEKGYDPSFGARPMRRAVERYLEDPLAEALLRGTVKEGDRVKAFLKDKEAKELDFSTLDSKKPDEVKAEG